MTLRAWRPEARLFRHVRTGQHAIYKHTPRLKAILIEREAEYVADIKRRLAHVRGDDTPLFSSA